MIVHSRWLEVIYEMVSSFSFFSTILMQMIINSGEYWQFLKKKQNRKHTFYGFLTLKNSKLLGAFHYAQDSEYFGRNSNGKVRFGFSDRIIRDPLISVGIFQPKFAVPFLTNWFFALIREIGNRKIGISIGWPGLSEKESFHFNWVFPLISDRSVWHTEKYPLTMIFSCGNPIDLSRTRSLNNKSRNNGNRFWRKLSVGILLKQLDNSLSISMRW